MENLLEKHDAAESAECNCCDGVDEGEGGVGGEQGLATDIWGTGIHASSSTAERD